MAAAAKLRTTLAAKPFDPPSRKQLAPDSVSQQALRFLIETGEAVEINAEVVLAAESLKRMTELDPPIHSGQRSLRRLVSFAKNSAAADGSSCRCLSDSTATASRCETVTLGHFAPSKLRQTVCRRKVC